MHPPRNTFRRLLAWLGGYEATVLCALSAIAAGMWMFAMLASEVNEGQTPSFDRQILLAMRQPDLSLKGSPAFQESARDVTALGGVVVLTLLTAATAGFLALDGKRHLAVYVCASVLTGLLVSSVLKDLFHRERPDIVPHAAYAENGSFPSGHSMVSAITYLTLGALLAQSRQRRALKVYFMSLAVLLTLLVGVSRVYLGVHWPTDVLAGWTAGAVWALLCWLCARQLQLHHTLESSEP